MQFFKNGHTEMKKNKELTPYPKDPAGYRMDINSDTYQWELEQTMLYPDDVKRHEEANGYSWQPIRSFIKVLAYAEQHPKYGMTVKTYSNRTQAEAKIQKLKACGMDFEIWVGPTRPFFILRNKP